MITTNLKDFLKNPDAYSGASFVNTHFDSEDIKDLTEALKVNTYLTSLNLWENNIADDGAITLAEVLKTNTSLTSLDLQDNNIGYNGIKAILAALGDNNALKSLYLNNNQPNEGVDSELAGSVMEE